MVVSAWLIRRPIGVFDFGPGRADGGAGHHGGPAAGVGRVLRRHRPVPVRAAPAGGDRGRSRSRSREYLVERDAKLIVVACNSATAAALDDVAAGRRRPGVGVIEPAVRAACQATRNGRVGLDRHAGHRVERRLPARLRRWTPRPDRDDRAGLPAVRRVRRTRGHHQPRAACWSPQSTWRCCECRVDTLILGCTHYPLLRAALRGVMGDGVALVSSADETAVAVYAVAAGERRAARRTRRRPSTLRVLRGHVDVRVAADLVLAARVPRRARACPSARGRRD